jgi:hypothetical protein
MIPDDATLVVRQRRTIVEWEKSDNKNIEYVCDSGFPAPLDIGAATHLIDFLNPHSDRVENILAAGVKAGAWLVLQNTSVGVTDLTPLYPKDIHPKLSIDELVKLDASSGAGTLASFAAFPLIISGGLRLCGDEMVGPRMFYGTNACGTMGFRKMPGKAVVV